MPDWLIQAGLAAATMAGFHLVTEPEPTSRLIGAVVGLVAQGFWLLDVFRGRSFRWGVFVVTVWFTGVYVKVLWRG